MKIHEKNIILPEHCLSPYYAEAGGTLLDMTEYTEEVQKKAEKNGVLIVANQFKEA